MAVGKQRKHSGELPADIQSCGDKGRGVLFSSHLHGLAQFVNIFRLNRYTQCMIIALWFFVNYMYLQASVYVVPNESSRVIGLSLHIKRRKGRIQGFHEQAITPIEALPNLGVLFCDGQVLIMQFV